MVEPRYGRGGARGEGGGLLTMNSTRRGGSGFLNVAEDSLDGDEPVGGVYGGVSMPSFPKAGVDVDGVGATWNREATTNSQNSARSGGCAMQMTGRWKQEDVRMSARLCMVHSRCIVGHSVCASLARSPLASLARLLGPSSPFGKRRSRRELSPEDARARIAASEREGGTGTQDGFGRAENRRCTRCVLYVQSTHPSARRGWCDPWCVRSEGLWQAPSQEIRAPKSNDEISRPPAVARRLSRTRKAHTQVFVCRAGCMELQRVRRVKEEEGSAMGGRKKTREICRDDRLCACLVGRRVKKKTSAC